MIHIAEKLEGVDKLETTVCLVRHGETEWNALGKLQGREDVDLTARGAEQAVLTSKYLERRTSWNVIMSSPLTRAKKTAEIISDHLHTDPVIFLDDLIERDLGIASGMSRAEIAERFPDGEIPGQEPLAFVQTRMMKTLEYATQRYSGQNIIMVSHGAAINALLSQLSDGKIGTGKMILQNACLNFVSNHDGKWSIEMYNFTNHLE